MKRIPDNSFGYYFMLTGWNHAYRLHSCKHRNTTENLTKLDNADLAWSIILSCRTEESGIKNRK
jgi:hypothetical protein